MQGLDDNSYFTAMFSKACEDICTNDDFELDIKERKPFTFKEFQDLNLKDVEHYRKTPEGILYRVDDETFKVLGEFKKIQDHIINYFQNIFGNNPFVPLPFSNIWINVMKVRSFNPYLIDFKHYSLPISHRLGYVNRVQYCKVLNKRKVLSGSKHVHIVSTTKKVDKFPEITKLMFQGVNIPIGTIAFERNLWIRFNESAHTSVTSFVAILWQQGDYYFKKKHSNRWERLDNYSIGFVTSPTTLGNTHIFYTKKQVLE